MKKIKQPAAKRMREAEEVICYKCHVRMIDRITFLKCPNCGRKEFKPAK